MATVFTFVAIPRASGVFRTEVATAPEVSPRNDQYGGDSISSAAITPHQADYGNADSHLIRISRW